MRKVPSSTEIKIYLPILQIYNFAGKKDFFNMYVDTCLVHILLIDDFTLQGPYKNIFLFINEPNKIQAAFIHLFSNYKPYLIMLL